MTRIATAALVGNGRFDRARRRPGARQSARTDGPPAANASIPLFADAMRQTAIIFSQPKIS